MIQMLHADVIGNEAAWPAKVGRSVWRGDSVRAKPKF